MRGWKNTCSSRQGLRSSSGSSAGSATSGDRKARPEPANAPGCRAGTSRSGSRRLAKPSDASAMKILALELSTPRRSVAVWSGGTVRGRAEITEGRPTPALALIDQALREARLEREQIDRVAVGLGPGRYTGIPLAIALAPGWQLARNVSLLGISSADCIVAQARTTGWRGRMRLLIDAHGQQFYRATYA